MVKDPAVDVPPSGSSEERSLSLDPPPETDKPVTLHVPPSGFKSQRSGNHPELISVQSEPIQGQRPGSPAWVQQQGDLEGQQAAGGGEESAKSPVTVYVYPDVRRFSAPASNQVPRLPTLHCIRVPVFHQKIVESDAACH